MESNNFNGREMVFVKIAEIPRPTLERLPLYFRSLSLWKDKGIITVSSVDIGRDVGVNVVQVRKDLAYFGEFGRPGVGYNVEYLMSELVKLLGFTINTRAVLIGAGRLGTAIVSYGGFQRYSVEVTALFDIDPEKYGQEVAGAPIKSLSELPSFLKENEIHLGIITVPAVVAQEVADILVANGMKAIWNFAPISLQVPAEVKVRNEDLAVGLATLCYFLNKENKKDAP